MMSLEIGECKGNAPLSNVIRTVVCSKPPLLTALLEISYSSVGREVQISNLIGDIAFGGGG